MREKIIDAMTRQVSCTCQAMGGSGEVVIVPGYAALINSDEIVDVLVETAEEVLGSQHIHPKKFPSLGVDFSWKRQREFSIIWDAPTGKKALQPPFTARTSISTKNVLSWECSCRPNWP
mgnify:CR=1 FL=1